MDWRQISPREDQVLRELLKGESNTDIARSLNIKEQTVKYHLTNIYRTYNVKTCRKLMAKLLVPKEG